MVIYADTYLPNEQELSVREVDLSSSFLQAGAYHVGKFCHEESKEFMLCRDEEKDPRKCIQEGKMVTSCALEFFQRMKLSCRQEIEKYAQCLDYSSSNLGFKHCRKTQAAFDKCVFDQLQQERPELGYFCRAHVHHTKRPKPEPETARDYPDATPMLPTQK